MQIHEITQQKIDEAIGSALGGFAGKIAAGAGALAQKFNPTAGFKAAYNQPVRTQQTAKLGKKVADIWANYVVQLKTATPDPARYTTMYQQALTAFVQKNLLAGQSINGAINKQEITQLITQITAAKDDPQQVATLIPKLVQQASVSQQDATATDPLIKIISTNPPVIQYRTISYALNQQGEWANQTTGKVPDESFGKFLDQEAKKAGVSI